MILIMVCLVGAGSWIYFATQGKQQAIRDSVARGDYQIPIKNDDEIASEDWRVIYPNTIPLRIGEVSVMASVADSMTERIKGLSDTPFLPDNVVKLFVFGTEGEHAIWMKDMNYAIDIIWVTKEGKIVHIENNVAPDTYPESFSSPVPAWYVIEANAGFVVQSSVKVGDKVALIEAGQ